MSVAVLRHKCIVSESCRCGVPSVLFDHSRELGCTVLCVYGMICGVKRESTFLWCIKRSKPPQTCLFPSRRPLHLTSSIQCVCVDYPVLYTLFIFCGVSRLQSKQCNLKLPQLKDSALLCNSSTRFLTLPPRQQDNAVYCLALFSETSVLFVFDAARDEISSSVCAAVLNGT